MFMEDGVNSFHVPQQSRKHKLRIIHQNYEQPSPTFQLTSGYVPSLPTPHTLPSAAANYPNFYDLHHSNKLPTDSPNPYPEPSRTFTNSPSHSSLSTNPNPIHDHFQSFNGDVPSSSRHGQGLSLSLSSQHCYNNNQLNSQRYDIVSDRADIPQPGNYEMLRSPVPLGPFTGYASILNRSRFLKPAQQVLDDLCGVDRDTIMMINSPSEDSLSATGGILKDPITCSDRVEHRWGNSRLVLLLEEVYKRYKLYCQQMQSVVTSFEVVSGLENAAPCISFAFKSMAKHFTCLKNVILDQIQLMGRTNLGYTEGLRKEETSMLRILDKKPVHNSVFPYPPVCRSQRGLPDQAVAVLKKWLFEHFLHPYPSDSDKQILAHQTGLSRNQVSNWFINARVRLWKPMVEEIHMLETRQDQRASEAENTRANHPVDNLQSTNPFPSEGPFQIRPGTQKCQSIEPICIRHELVPHTSRPSGSWAEESSGVSLALGLYQSNGIELSVPFPTNIAQHFGLQTDTEVYMRNSFEG